METITVFLTPAEAELFKEWQRNYSLFMVLNNSGVFTITNGSAILNFDSDGTLKTIQRADILYHK